LEYRGYTIIYRRYASLYFIVGTSGDGRLESGDYSSDTVTLDAASNLTSEDTNSNELGYLELIHTLVETLDKYFESFCELDIMFNIEKAHFILDEMVQNGVIVDTNKYNALPPLYIMEKHSMGLM